MPGITLGPVHVAHGIRHTVKMTVVMIITSFLDKMAVDILFEKTPQASGPIPSDSDARRSLSLVHAANGELSERSTSPPRGNLG